MGYQALLFCPDEKTARSVTHVLGELEFNVELCSEAFAAVKKLMSEHFDAIVVDCDNEQNATLLFKSARNSTPNQTSLAVAVVEGQAGVAKAFRIGANLVLTKPINVEQSKGTLRVARGLLRKGEPGKSSAPAVTAGMPAKPAGSVPRPVVPPTVKPAASPLQPAPAAMANSVLPAPSHEAPANQGSEAAAAPAMAASAEPPTVKKTLPAKSPLSSGPIPATLEEARAALQSSPTLAHGSGAASAPAPARDILEMPPLEVLPSVSTPEEDDILESPGGEHSRASSEHAKDVPPPSFTLGGASALERSGTAKKIVLGLVAAVLVAGAAYAGWTYFGGHSAQPVGAPTPVSKPSDTQPAPAPTSQLPAPAAPAPPAVAPATNTPSENNEAVSGKAASGKAASGEDTAEVSPSPKKPAPSASSAASKTAPEEEPAEEPLVVKGGSVPAKPAPVEATDTPPPSVIGIATPGSSGPLPDLGGPDTSKPVLQRLNVSQGVSQGLLIKRVAPVYPATALRLRIEGTVQLLATISAEGIITDIKVLSGDQQLTKAATDAVKQWKYKPYLLNGEPVEIQTQVTINFSLPH